jgi:hypothetical protein
MPARALRHLMMSTVKTTSSFLRDQIGEGGLTSMFEHQAEEFASTVRRTVIRADKLAKDTIVYNFQPLGIEATYFGDAGEARIVVESCSVCRVVMPRIGERLGFQWESGTTGSIDPQSACSPSQ